MAPSDQVLELVFSFLLEKGKAGQEQLVARPACRLLQARRARGFEHVKQELLRRGLKWALETKLFWERRARRLEVELQESEHWVQTYRNVRWEADRLRLTAAHGEWTFNDFQPRSDRDRESDFR